MLTKAPHLFDDATRVATGDSRWTGHTSDDYWAFVGPFGGVTAATMLRAIIQHPQRCGDPLSLTVNFCAPIEQGAFDLEGDELAAAGNFDQRHGPGHRPNCAIEPKLADERHALHRLTRHLARGSRVGRGLADRLRRPPAQRPVD